VDGRRRQVNILESEDVRNVNIESIIREKKFHHVFQPIYYLANWSLCGYEALFRSELFRNPEVVFEMARKQKNLFELDTASIYHSAFTYFAAKRDGFLFFNIFPSTLLHPAFFSFMERFFADIHIPGKNVVLEINEAEEITDVQKLWEVISFLRRNGFRIAFDDVGKGASSFHDIIRFQPDYIKLDQYFSKGLARSPKKQKIIKMILEYCSKDVQVILEGLEKPEDLAIAKVLGVPMGQGYLLGAPDTLQEL
jgi:EAL domain-containing protein (putative c-di-GMP-specific phosphodiesterase class I)